MNEEAHIEALLGEPLDAAAKGPAMNRQLYENSPLSGSPVEEHYDALDDRFYGDKRPNLAVQREKPEHRIVIFLKAQGLANREIAQRTGYTEPWISQVLRQPWARERLVAEMREAGRDAVQELIKASAEDSVFTLISLRDDPKAPASVRAAASNSLLDRYLGKPTQKVESHNTNVNGTLADLDALNKELATLEAEEQRLTGKN